MTWKLIDGVIYKNKEKNKNIKEIISKNDSIIKDKGNIVNEFHYYFAEVGVNMSDYVKIKWFYEIKLERY